ncbi:MAG: alpha/beta hydrolase [Parabacteroides sp.]|nr:alpha/beta hydrolase [Parabacteroides sp.]
MKRIIFLMSFLMTIGSAFALEPFTTVHLYPDGVPDSNGYTEQEYTDDLGRIFFTTDARFDLYVPEGKENIPVLLCFPGGAYRLTSAYGEGKTVAEYLVTRGYAVAVLKYRFPNTHTEVPIHDAIRAMEILRDNAETWHLNPHKIGAMGFSAGGHLCSSLLTKYTSEKSRPDFGVLFYPVISMNPAITHQMTHDLLLGENPTHEMEDLWSTDKCVTKDTPPCLIFACQDDNTVAVENSILFYQALTRNHVTAGMILMPTGKHGWGFNYQFDGREVVEHALMQFLSER